MYKQTYGNNPQLRYEQQAAIQGDGWFSMQGMKADAAAVWIVDGICQQVIQVNKDGRTHNQPGAPPVGFETKSCNESRDSKVRENMQTTTDHRLRARKNIKTRIMPKMPVN